MKPIPRRKFIQGTALAGGALLFLPSLKACKFLDTSSSGNYFLNEFGIDETLCRKLLAKALSRGGDFADLFFEFTVSNYIGLEDGKVNRSYGDISLGVGIRTVMGDQIGYGYTQDLTEESMMSAAATASTLCDMTAAGIGSSFSRLQTGNYYPVAADFDGIPAQSKLPLLQELNQKCFAISPEIIKVNAGFQSSAKRILNSIERWCHGRRYHPWRVYLLVRSSREKRETRTVILEPWRTAVILSFYNVDVINEVATKSVNNALKLFDAIQPPAGEMPVVLGPGITGILLHEAIGHGMEADFNRKKISTYSTMLGQKSSRTFCDYHRRRHQYEPCG